MLIFFFLSLDFCDNKEFYIKRQNSLSFPPFVFVSVGTFVVYKHCSSFIIIYYYLLSGTEILLKLDEKKMDENVKFAKEVKW